MRKVAWLLMLLASVQVTAKAQKYTVITVSHAENLISEIDPVSGQTLRKFVVMPGEWAGETHEGCVTSDGKTAYVTLPYAKYVLMFDLQTFTPSRKLESEYFSRVSSHTQTTRRGGTVESTSAEPHGIALSNDESKLYITVEFGDVPGIVVYDLKAGQSKKIDTVVMGDSLGIHPRTGKLYVPNRTAADNVTVIDTKTDSIIKVIPLKAGTRPGGVAFGGPNDEVWISGDGDGSVAMIESKTDKVIKLLHPRTNGGVRIVNSPDGRFVAATQGREVSIIDTTTQGIIATHPISPDGMDVGHGYPVFSPDGNKLHVMNESSGDMVTIDMKDLSAAPIRSAHIGNNSFGGGIRVISQ
jgi:YVTN family beta-propeller protein